MGLGRNYSDKHAQTAFHIRRFLGDDLDDVVWTSEPTPWGGAENVYNCFGFIMDSAAWWEPPGIPGDNEGDPRYFWPNELEDVGPWIANFIAAAQMRDFNDCGQDSSWEGPFEKIVLLRSRGTFAHAALQISPDRWKSKLGQLSDFEHSLESILAIYPGHRTTFMKRERRTRTLG